jgi:hypothetical protein
MKIFKKNLYVACLVLALTIVVSITHVNGAPSSEMTIQEKAIAAITEVIGLDMAKYKTELTSNVADQPEIYGGLIREEVTYTIETTGSRAQIGCTFVNKTLTSCYMYPIEGSLLYAQPLSADMLNATRSLLQRYQAYSGAAYLQEARSILETVTEIKQTNVTMGNMKLQITGSDNLIDIIWWQTINGVDFPLGLSVEFVNGKLKGFSDYSSFYHIGSATVNISQEEAIRITKEQAKGYTTLKVPTDNGDYIEVTLNLTDEHMIVELQVANREPLTMYPLWYVRLYAEKAYGGTDGFQAGIWADTGEIAYAQLTGYHGVISDENSSNQSPTPSQNSFDQSLALYLFAGTAVTVIVATALLLLKKRSK